MVSCEHSELENIRYSYCQQSEQQGSAKQVLIFNVIIKNKVINYSFASETSLRIIRGFYFGKTKFSTNA